VATARKGNEELNRVRENARATIVARYNLAEILPVQAAILTGIAAL
jgi:hypothetical protein